MGKAGRRGEGDETLWAEGLRHHLRRNRNREITAELLPCQKATDRPNLVARVFHARKLQFREMVKKCFGERVMVIDVVETPREPASQLAVGFLGGAPECAG